MNYSATKGWFSINVQVIVNARLEIIDIVARWPGFPCFQGHHVVKILNLIKILFLRQKNSFAFACFNLKKKFIMSFYII